MKIHLKVVATLGLGTAALCSMSALFPAAAGTLNLNGGSTASYTQNNVGSGGSGVVSGTLQQGGTSTPFSCGYDVVTGNITGPAACAQILGGAATGGLSLAQLTTQIVAARINVVANLQANTNIQLIDDLVGRRVDADLVLQAQADMQAGNSKGSAFGDPAFGTWAYTGGGIFNDDRTGLDKSGHDIVATAALDHRGGNFLIGGLVGYEGSDVDLKSLAGNLTSNGWILGAYATYVLGPVFSVTASGTYAHSDVDADRTSVGTIVTSSYGHGEWSAGLTGNAFWRLNETLGLSLQAGIDEGGWRDGSYTDSSGLSFGSVTDHNTCLQFGSVLTLFPTGTIRPYVNASYGHLLSNPTYVLDRDTLTIGGGLLAVGRRLSGAIGVSTLLLQSGQNDTTIALSLRLSI